MNRCKNFIEWHVFGVCSWAGDKMGISPVTIRKYFIYVSFLTLGSPIVIYLVTAFFMNLKHYVMSGKRNPLRYL